ncbi:poly(rC)-binding protein 3-like isoform X2 [Halichondria panicea]|uniref:poly(rC)-binding protein 3-like isoform X2 n=1 Tax=Halichondria panicea TaxID=6063 RepID=UPI00312B68C7
MADNVDTTDLQPHVQAHNSTHTSTTCRENGSSPRLKVECTGPRGGLEGESEGDTLVDCQEANMDVEMSRYGADDPTEPVLSLRMLMNSKDVGSIIGKGGMTIKAFRETSGARINISNSTSSERLVQVTGSRESITRAFSDIGRKILIDGICSSRTQDMADEEDREDRGSDEDSDVPQVTFRLVIQTSQCGSLIGKGGTRIKQIRETTGSSIQVAGETLPNSTERAVTVSGSPDSLTACIGQICKIMLENPPRGPNIPYKPHALPNQAYQQPRMSPNIPFQSPYTATFHPAAGPATTSQQMRIPNDVFDWMCYRT